MSSAVKAIVGVVFILVGTFTSAFGGVWLVKVGAILLLNAASEALTPGPGRPPLSPVSVAYSGTLEPRRLLYGKMKLSGMHTLPPLTSGANNDLMHVVLSITGHHPEAVDDVYLGASK
jgi:hypothetical protein